MTILIFLSSQVTFTEPKVQSISRQRCPPCPPPPLYVVTLLETPKGGEGKNPKSYIIFKFKNRVSPQQQNFIASKQELLIQYDRILIVRPFCCTMWCFKFHGLGRSLGQFIHFFNKVTHIFIYALN